MMKNLIKSAAIAAAALGGIAATPAAAHGRYDRGGYENSYRNDDRSGSSRWDRDRDDRHDRRSWRRDRDDDGRGHWRDRDDDRGHHRHWRGRDD